jgi:uncharacterized membrane protein (UPF0127 family)
MKIKVNGEFSELDVKTCTEFGKVKGLMFTPRKGARALLFNFPHEVRLAIHSLFVFFPFFAIWLDDKNRIIDIKRVKPFRLTVLPKKPFYRLIEIPINDRYEKITSVLVDKHKI